MVLTQRGGTAKGGGQRRFHTTMVLTQHDMSVHGEALVSSFHTTMVLTQLKKTRRRAATLGGFHTTMVLTQLSPPEPTCLTLGFHTTMVLTQQLLLQKLYMIGGGEVKSIEFLC